MYVNFSEQGVIALNMFQPIQILYDQHEMFAKIIKYTKHYHLEVTQSEHNLFCLHPTPPVISEL